VKKLLIALGVIVVLLIAAVVIIPAVVPIDTYKKEIESQVTAATGRPFAINGDVSVSVIPNVALEVNDVAFGNAEGGRAPQMASLKQLQIDVQLFPLIGGELAIDRFVLIEPEINLEVLPDGSANWNIAGAGGAASEGESTGAGTMGPEQIRLGDVRLEGGRVTYFDAATGEEQVLSDVNMSLELPSLDAPMSADGSMVWQGEEISITLNADELRALMTGGSTAVGLEVASNPVNLNYTGTVTGGADGSATGDVTLNVPSVRDLMTWVGTPMEPGEGFQLLNIAGQMSAAAGRASFSDATIAFDEIKGTGEVSIDTTGEIPAVVGRLDLEQLDLNPYLPEPSGDGDAGGSSGPGQWSDDPLDFSELKRFNADLGLSAAGIKAQDITVGPSALQIAISGGKLVADLTELNLYDGRGSGQIVLDGTGSLPAVTETFTLVGIQAEPFLRDAAGSDRLSGTGNLRVDVRTTGASQREMVNNLNGDGAFEFRDGAVKGINLGAMIRNVTSAFLSAEADEPQKTDFSELAATFTITNGILSNNDLAMSAPLFRVVGEGTADLPNRTVNYRITPKLVASTEGQGGDQALKGLAVPIIVTGPWHDLSYAPDLAAAIDPSALIEGAGGAAQGLIEGAGGAAGDIIGGATGAGGDPAGAVGGAIQGIIGGGDSGGGETESETTGDGAESGGGIGLPDPAGAVKSLFGD